MITYKKNGRNLMDKATYEKHNRRVNAAKVPKKASTKKKIMLSAAQIYLKGI